MTAPRAAARLMARAALRSLDQTLAVRPMAESFAIRTASSSSLKGTMATTGPKISSRIAGESGATLSRTRREGNCPSRARDRGGFEL